MGKCGVKWGKMCNFVAICSKQNINAIIRQHRSKNRCQGQGVPAGLFSQGASGIGRGVSHPAEGCLSVMSRTVSGKDMERADGCAATTT